MLESRYYAPPGSIDGLTTSLMVCAGVLQLFPGRLNVLMDNLLKNHAHYIDLKLEALQPESEEAEKLRQNKKTMAQKYGHLGTPRPRTARRSLQQKHRRSSDISGFRLKSQPRDTTMAGSLPAAEINDDKSAAEDTDRKRAMRRRSSFSF